MKVKAFTILDILVTLVLIAILSTLVIIAVNPQKNFSEARNEQRISDLKSITNGLQQYVVDHQGQNYPLLDNKLRMFGTANEGCTVSCTVIDAQGESVNNLTYTAETSTDFNLGYYNNTFFNNATQMLELNSAGKTAKIGEYTSQIIDAQTATMWKSLTWLPQDKYNFELPDNGAIVDTGTAGIINMSGNQLLLHLDELNGSIANDTSGASNNGNKSDTTITKGQFDNALKFNGLSSFVNIPNSASLNPTNAISIEAWVRWDINPSSGANWAQIINKNGDYQYQIQHNQYNSKFEFALTTSVGRRYIIGTTTPQQGVWYYLTATYDGLMMKLYVNGVLEVSNSVVGTIVTSLTPINLGRRTLLDRYFNGSIDEVAIYNRALNSSEILNRYQIGKAELQFQIRSCPNADCSGNPFIGPDNTNSTFYEASKLSSLDFGSNLISRYFQYKITYKTGGGTFTPRINRITINSESLNIGSTNTEAACIDLTPLVDDGELAMAPFDPLDGNKTRTLYAARIINGVTQIYSCNSELDTIIMRSFR